MTVIIVDNQPDRRKHINGILLARDLNVSCYGGIFFNEEKGYYFLDDNTDDNTKTYSSDIQNKKILIVHLGTGERCEGDEGRWGNGYSIDYITAELKADEGLYVIGYSGTSASVRINQWDNIIGNGGDLASYANRIYYSFAVNTGKELNWNNFFTVWKQSEYKDLALFAELKKWENTSAVYNILKFGYEVAHGKTAGFDEKNNEMSKKTEQATWWEPLLSHPGYDSFRPLGELDADREIADLLKGFGSQ